jgi:hypothetical protein
MQTDSPLECVRQFAARVNAALANGQDVDAHVRLGVTSNGLDKQGWEQKRLDGSAVLTVIISPRARTAAGANSTTPARRGREGRRV